MFTFPKPLNDVHRVYFSKQKLPNSLNSTELSNVWLAIFEVRLHEDFMVDDYIIVDLEHYSLSDIKRVTPMIVTKFLAVYKVKICVIQ